MATKKYLALIAGIYKEVVGLVVSAGVADAGKFVATGDDGKLDNSLFPTGIGAETKVIEASENLSAGDFVNVYDDGSTASVRKADASGANAGKVADGFVLEAVVSGANATVYGAGINNQCTGLTVGPQFLSAATPGAAVSAPPATSGSTVQRIGVALSATEIAFNPQILAVLA